METAQLCPPGTEITTIDECKDAFKFASDMDISGKGFLSGSWSWVPYQCSYQSTDERQRFHFNSEKTSNDIDEFINGAYKMICKNGKLYKHVVVQPCKYALRYLK